MTERMTVTFDTKVNVDNTPWIVFEIFPHKLQGLQQGFLGFDLKAGSSYEEVQALTNSLNNLVENVSFTACE